MSSNMKKTRSLAYDATSLPTKDRTGSTEIVSTLLISTDYWLTHLCQSLNHPILLDHALLNLLLLILFQSRNPDMLSMPRVLVLHKILLALLHYLQYQTRNIWLVSELGHWCEESFEIEYNGA